MNQADWRRVLELFDEGSEVSPGERDRWLDSACGVDTGLRAEVERLLQANDSEDGFLEDNIATYASGLAGAAAPRRIGPYRILREIARGGMGSVYLAERADEHYRAQVAIKLVHAGSISHAQFQRRFLRERQILASLRHPNIASLLDGGITEEGIPYLVMEYVDGPRVDEYCRRESLSLTGRIRLFQQICLAVQHAHRSLIVHRDIKPSNIMVTAEGEPKLLDFGIAKNLAAAGPALTVALTRPAQRVMTLEYASPEQFRGENVTTATDVYSLGILLYEILADRHPFEAQRADFLSLQHAVCNLDPPALTLAAGLGKGGETVRDLQYIVMKAIRKQPAARYGSVERLSDDLERYLGGYPVLARQGDRRYRASKFIRRHLVSLSAAAGVALLLIGFSVAMGTLAANLKRERDIANRQRVSAETEADFLNSLFNASDPYKQTGAMPSARDLLDRGAERISKELDSQPAVRAVLLDGIAQAYQHLALPARAMQIYRQEAVAADQAFGPDSEEKAHVLRQLGDMERDGDDLADAEIHLRQALAIVSRLPGGGSVRRAVGTTGPDEAAHVNNNLALLLQATGKWPEAEADFRRAIAIAARFPDAAAEVFTMKSNLASLMISEHRYRDAESMIRDVLTGRRRMLGENHPFVGTSLRMLASVRRAEGHFHEAVALCRQAIAVYQMTLKAGHPYYQAANGLLARALRDEGRFVESESYFRKTVEAEEAMPGRQELASAHGAELAELLLLEGKEKDATQAVDRASVLARSLKSGLPLARVLIPRGQLEIATGKPTAGEKDLDEAMAILGQLPEPMRFGASDALFYRAEALRLERKSDAAEEAYKNAIGIDRKNGESEKLTLATHLLGYGVFLSTRDEAAEGENLAREGLQIREQTMDRDAWQTDFARSILAVTLLKQGRRDEALALANNAKTNLERKLGSAARPVAAASAAVRDPALAGAERLLCCTY